MRRFVWVRVRVIYRNYHSLWPAAIPHLRRNYAVVIQAISSPEPVIAGHARSLKYLPSPNVVERT